MTADISEIIQNGILFDMKNWENLSSNTDNLPAIIDRLFLIMQERNIDYLLVGGVALLSYIEGRNTQDIDLIIAKTDLNYVPEIQIIEENKDFAFGQFNNLRVDLLFTQNFLFDTVIRNCVAERQFGERLVKCVTVEGLILLKLYALPSLYRQGQFSRVSIYENDILLLMLNYNIDISHLFQTLTPHVLVTDLQEIQNAVADIQARIQRFQAQKRNLDGSE
ncbi:MAG: hypothetical protein GDA56_18815 [Hormoscilla sp. GM7CHS1pb]|nr:hypothetical protein [Hormoscilla sp. GM7CHS1pb]